MSQPQEQPFRPAKDIIGPGHSYGTITDKISESVLTGEIRKGWVIGLFISFCFVMLLLGAITWLFVEGIGIWGLNIPVAWGFAIINFVWWIGIGHAGTLISAVLLLLHQKWRTSINRFAEAMTLFAVACAGLFPILHLGRPHLFYWLMPYPNTMDLWPQFRSPLVWDVFAISTYATVSALFWYVGLIPDLATMRDKAKNKLSKVLYGMFSLGWRGSATHWYRYEMAYLLLAGLATPLVVSVHSIVGLDFASSLIPGWHATIFPPYFVAGAIYSGFAMVLTLAIPIRKFFHLEDFITVRHLDNMAKVILATGLIVAYGYAMELFFGFYSGSIYEEALHENRMYGPYAWSYWALILCNVVAPQFLWIKKLRQSIVALFIMSLVVNVGMWLERFVIVVTSLHRDFLPSSWDMYYPTFWDWATYLGTIGLFLTLLFLFIRFLPMISIFEMRELLANKKKAEKRLQPESAPAEEIVGGPTEVLEDEPWGVAAEFQRPSELLKATHLAKDKGYEVLEAYSPFPVHGLPETVGKRRGRLKWLVLAGGVFGGLAGFLLQYYSAVVDYPMNVGGRPDYSWPAFIPVTFECTILGAALAAVLGMLAMNKLPQPYHPMFNDREFARASKDRFFLCILARDPKYDRMEVRAFMESLGAQRVAEVAP